MNDGAERAAQVQAFLRSRRRRRGRDVVLVLGAIGGIVAAAWVAIATTPSRQFESQYDYIVRISTADPTRYGPAVAGIAFEPVGTPRVRSEFCDYTGRLSGVNRLRAAAGVDANVEVSVSYTVFVRAPGSGETTVARTTIQARSDTDSVTLYIARERLPDGLCQVLDGVAVRVSGCVLETPRQPRSCFGRVIGQGE